MNGLAVRWVLRNGAMSTRDGMDVRGRTHTGLCFEKVPPNGAVRLVQPFTAYKYFFLHMLLVPGNMMGRADFVVDHHATGLRSKDCDRKKKWKAYFSWP